jgi:hypothetical protein
MLSQVEREIGTDDIYLPLKCYTNLCDVQSSNETLKKYCILQVQIKEEEQDFQGSIGSVRESLLQQMEPNIKQINDHCKAGEEILQLQKSFTEHKSCSSSLI